MLGLWMLAAGVMNPAAAFCGTYVGGAGDSVGNAASRIAVVRENGETTLTMENDFEGDLTTFGLLIPVPAEVGEGDVSIADAGLLDALDVYSAPRLVEYTCQDLAPQAVQDSAGCGTYTDDGGRDSAAYDVATDLTWSPPVVEDRFTVGEYDVSVLSGRNEGALTAWLDANGFVMDMDTETLVQEYAGPDAFFLAIRIDLEALDPDRTWLSPLQIRYEADSLGLPIRLGTLSSTGVQDLIMYVLTEGDVGRVGISNYPEAVLEDECMIVADDGESLALFYELLFQGAMDAAVDDGTGATWVTEYSWGAGKCDPCPPGETFDDSIVQGLGFTGYATQSFLTRIHMRYAPEAITQDLVFYEAGTFESSQMRFVRYAEEFEELYPICGLGFAEDPGTCGYSADTGGADVAIDEVDETTEPRAWGCVSLPGGGLPAVFAVVGVVALLRRRRPA